MTAKLTNLRTISHLIALTFLTTCATCTHAQLSGQVDLVGSSTRSDTAGIKEITVTGIGTTLESAEKQALAAAIRQAVGAYVDSKELIENEEVIRESLLTVSNAFVEGYQTIGQPRKSVEGLIEITIIAKVNTNQVVKKLKEVNLISGDVAGHNLWAEASTKVMNARDAVAMLEAKLPELIKNSVVITPLDKAGQPNVMKTSSGNSLANTAPAEMMQDPVTGTAELLWIFAISIDQQFYKEKILPMIETCFNAITGLRPIEKKARFRPSQKLLTGDPVTNWALDDKLKSLKFKGKILNPEIYRVLSDGKMNVVKSFSKTFDECKYISYNSNAVERLEFFSDELGWTPVHLNHTGCYLVIELIDSNGDLIASTERECWQPFDWSRNLTGPICQEDYGLPVILFAGGKVPIEVLKDIKKINVSLKVPPMRVILRSN